MTNPGRNRATGPTILNRREQMLSVLLHSMESHHRTRRARRRNLATVAVLMPIFIGFYLGDVSTRPPELTTEAFVPTEFPSDVPANADSAELSLDMAIVGGRSGVVAKYSMTPTIRIERSYSTRPISLQRIDDDELLRTLFAMRRPTGLIQVNGEVLLTRPVANAGPVDVHNSPQRIPNGT